MVQTLVREKIFLYICMVEKPSYWPLPCEFLMVSSLLHRKFAPKLKIKLSPDSFIVQRRDQSVLNVIGIIIKIKFRFSFQSTCHCPFIVHQVIVAY